MLVYTKIRPSYTRLLQSLNFPLIKLPPIGKMKRVTRGGQGTSMNNTMVFDDKRSPEKLVIKYTMHYEIILKYDNRIN